MTALRRQISTGASIGARGAIKELYFGILRDATRGSAQIWYETFERLKVVKKDCGGCGNRADDRPLLSGSERRRSGLKAHVLRRQTRIRACEFV
jgi:hypothetical protein